MATPSWTDTGSSIISDQVLARGSIVAGTLALAAKYGAFIFVALGRGGTTALTNGVDVLIRRTINANAKAHVGAIVARLSTIVAASSTTCATSNSNSGQTALNVASVTGFAAGDLICIQDSGGGVTRLEWARVSKTAAGVLTLDRNLEFTHTSAGADTVRNKADVFPPIWVPGGCTYEVIVDYGDDSAGESVTVRVISQVFDSEG